VRDARSCRPRCGRTERLTCQAGRTLWDEAGQPQVTDGIPERNVLMPDRGSEHSVEDRVLLGVVAPGVPGARPAEPGVIPCFRNMAAVHELVHAQLAPLPDVGRPAVKSQGEPAAT
jgi:hypothetical protein